MRRTLAIALAAILAVGLSLASAADEQKPKHTIKQVMKKAHTPDGGLLKKIVSGEGTKADAEQLVEFYTALGQNKPPQGDPGSWQEKTGELLEAAKDVVADKEGSKARLEKAANCKNCHTAHKPPAP